MKTAILFPGQGSQVVGMGQDVFRESEAAHRIFTLADEALGESLTNLCFEGPQEALNLTANTQPALLATSAALVNTLLATVDLDITFIAGHSLGEYTALWFAGAFDIQTAIRLVRIRGEAMQNATPEGVGAMAAVIGLEEDDIRAICLEAADGEVVTPANFNAPGQIVVSGHRGAVERAVELASAKGARKSVMLPVSAPFHCPLMQPAAERMKAELAAIDPGDVLSPVVCNVTAEPMENEPDAIRNALVTQIVSPVQWVRSIRTMADQGVELFLEIGPGKVLTTLAKRIAPDIQRMNISDLMGIQKFIDFLWESQ
ncbi:MAG TPA: ACP S-malonyltransferase [bacterium]|mgnify:CR=1 FL=1|nr:ACP S-malonyltransferase [bacterium]